MARLWRDQVKRVELAIFLVASAAGSARGAGIRM